MSPSRDLQRRLGRRLDGRRRGGQRHLLVLECADASRQREQPNESSRIAWLVHIVLAEGDETLVVQRVLTLAPTTAVEPLYKRSVTEPVTRSCVTATKASYASRSVVHH